MHAYPRYAAQNGGQVGVADGSVRLLTAAEFKELWALQEPTMSSAIIVQPPAAGSSAPPSGGGSAPPPPPPAAGSAPPPPPTPPG